MLHLHSIVMFDLRTVNRIDKSDVLVARYKSVCVCNNERLAINNSEPNFKGYL